MHADSAQEFQREEFFNTHAAGWEARNYPPEKLRQVDQLMSSLPLAQAEVIIDVGCGEGVLQPYCANTPARMQHCWRLTRRLTCCSASWPGFPHVRTYQARAESMPLTDASADMVICFSAFPHIGDKQAAAREFYRILRPTGRAYVLHIDGREKLNQLHDSHHAVEGDHLPCPTGMSIIFTTAGFTSIEAHEGPRSLLFLRCQKMSAAMKKAAVFLWLVLLFCSTASQAADAVRVVAGTSLISDIVADLTQNRCEILTLNQGSSCPGHENASTGDYVFAARANLLLIHPFQRNLQQVSAMLAAVDNPKLKVAEVSPRNSWLIPQVQKQAVNEISRRAGGHCPRTCTGHTAQGSPADATHRRG